MIDLREAGLLEKVKNLNNISFLPDFQADADSNNNVSAGGGIFQISTTSREINNLKMLAPADAHIVEQVDVIAYRIPRDWLIRLLHSPSFQCVGTSLLFVLILLIILIYPRILDYAVFTNFDQGKRRCVPSMMISY